jgi:hypothetical protein
LGGVSSKALFVGANASGNFVLRYGHITIFAWFWFYPYGTSSCRLGWNLALGRTRKFARATMAFVPFTATMTSSKTVSALLALHSLDTNSPYSDSLLDFQLYSNLELFMDSFRLTFLCMFHLLVGGPSSIVFKHLQDFFNPKDLASGFI